MRRPAMEGGLRRQRAWDGVVTGPLHIIENGLAAGRLRHRPQSLGPAFPKPDPGEAETTRFHGGGAGFLKRLFLIRLALHYLIDMA